MSERTTRTRRLGLLPVALAVLATVCACSGTGVEVQNGSTTPTPSSPSNPPTSSTAPSPADSTTNTTGYGDAQPAVDTFLALSAAYNNALKSPATISASTFSQFVAGQAKEVFEQSLADEKAQGKAFRGAPPVDRLVVSSSDSAGSVPAVTLDDCVLSSTADPWTEYIVATGVAVPTTSPANVSPPYAATIKLFKPTAAGWVVTSFTLDATKTCSR